MTFLILPIHNENVSEFIKCLRAQTVKPWMIVWVDSGTKDCGTCEATAPGCYYECIRVSSGNYWAGSLQAGQRYIARLARPMNNDTTFGPDFIETAVKHCKPGRIVHWAGDGKRVLWEWIFTRQFGAISTVNSLIPNALSNRAVFMMWSDFERVKFHKWLLPHYCSDYAWTCKALKRLEPFAPFDLELTVDETRTGITEPETIRELFSIKCVHNPIYYSVYVLMCAPLLWKIPNLVRVWGYAMVRMWRIIRKGK